MCVAPAIAMVPLRAGPVLAATENATVPLPVPLAPLVIEIHDVVDVAVHAHPAALVTVTGVAAPPAAGTDWLAELIVETHAPTCVTVNV